MKKIWDFITKSVGTLVILFCAGIGISIIIDMIKTKLEDDDIDYIDGSEHCPYCVGDTE